MENKKWMALGIFLVFAVALSTSAFAAQPEQITVKIQERQMAQVRLEQTEGLTTAQLQNKTVGLKNALQHVTNANARARIEANILKQSECKKTCDVEINASIDGKETKIKKTVPGKFLGLFKADQVDETTLDQDGNVVAQKQNGWRRFGLLVLDE